MKKKEIIKEQKLDLYLQNLAIETLSGKLKNVTAQRDELKEMSDLDASTIDGLFQGALRDAETIGELREEVENLKKTVGDLRNNLYYITYYTPYPSPDLVTLNLT